MLAYPILKQYGINGTSYLDTKAIDEKYPERLSWAQIKQMRAAGWVFGCHSFEHNRMEDMTDAQIRYSMEMVNRSFTKQGLRTPEIMAYPYGCYNARVIDDIKAYRKQVRLANNLTTNFVESGCSGAQKFHADAPWRSARAVSRSASSMMASNSFQDVQWHSRSRKARQPGTSRR